LLLVALSAIAAPSISLAEPFVKILSPATGTVVHPGQRLSVVVDFDPFTFFTVIVLPFLEVTPDAFGVPYSTQIEIPSDLSSGTYLVGAAGVPRHGRIPKEPEMWRTWYRDTIEIDVEQAESPKQLTYELFGEFNVPEGLHKIGDVRWLRITGTFTGNIKVELTRSKLTSYESSAPYIVSVDETGKVTVVGAGTAAITIRNGDVKITIPVTVPKEE
jgi:hypothetical protein